MGIYSVLEKGSYATQSLQAKLEQANSENTLLREQLNLLRDQLTEKDNQLAHRNEQINHLTQFLAVQTKTSAALTDRLQMIEDMRNRSLFRRGAFR